MGGGDLGTVYTLSAAGGSAWTLLDWGAAIVSVRIPVEREGGRKDGSQGEAELAVGFSDYRLYKEGHPYFGSTVGRVANRIAFGKFRIGSRTFTLDLNDGKHHLHGGVSGFSWKRWDSRVVPGSGGDAVRFELDSPAEEGGYPGNLHAAVQYELLDSWTLSIRLSAETDVPTPVNMTNHAYWNLSGEETIRSHTLQLFGSDYLETSPDLIPTGRRISAKGSPLDFSSPRLVGEMIESCGGCDVCFMRNPGKPGKALPAARVIHEETGRCLDVFSTQPGLQVYTGNFLDGTLAGRDGKPIRRYGGLCLEPQFPPDSPNRPEFPSIIIRPDAPFSEEIVYKVGYIH